MPRKNQRKIPLSSAEAENLLPTAVANVGARRIKIRYRGKERFLDISIRDYSTPTLAAQLADSWIDHADSLSYPAAALYRQAIMSFLEYVNERTSSDLELAADADTIARYTLGWFKHLRDSYHVSSTMPYQLSTRLQNAVHAQIQDTGDSSKLLEAISSSPTPLVKPEPNEIPEFTPEERAKLVKAARRHVRVFESGRKWAMDVITGTTELRGSNGDDLTWMFNRAYELRLQISDSGRINTPQIRNLIPRDIRRLTQNLNAVDLTYQIIFPPPSVLFAYRLLLLEATGISADEITTLELTRIRRSENILRLDLVKPRANRTRTLEFERNGHRRPWSVDGLLTRISAATADLRAMTRDPDELEALWVTCARNGATGKYAVQLCDFTGNQTRLNSWLAAMKKIGVDAEVSEPLDIRRIRKGRIAERAIALGGNMADITLDEHTEQVFVKYYAHTSAIQVYSASNITQAQESLSRIARTGLAVFTESRENVPSEKIADIAQIDSDSAQRVKNGSHSVGIVDCSDPMSSPFGKDGLLCRSAPMYCMLCPNAMVFPSHAPYIRSFAASLQDLQSSMAPDEWAASWGSQLEVAKRVLAELSAAGAGGDYSVERSDLPSWIVGWKDV